MQKKNLYYITLIIFLSLPTVPYLSVQAQTSTKTNSTNVNQDLNLLAYQVYLNNNNAEKAYEIATNAVKAKPHDIEWRKRLAQAAVWTGRMSQAFEEYLYIAKNTQQSQDLQIAVKLAEQLHAYDQWRELLKIQQQHAPNDINLKLTRAYVEEQLGNPRIAEQILQHSLQQQPNSKTLNKLAKLQLLLGQNNQAIQSYKTLIALSLQQQTAENYSELGSLYEKQQNSAEALQVYLQAYQHGINSDLIIGKIADLAWNQNNTATAKQMYLELYKKHQLNSSELYRLIYLSTDNPSVALPIAKELWTQAPNLANYTQLVDLATTNKDWSYIMKVNKNLDPYLKQAVLNTSVYWYSLIGNAQANNDVEKTLSLFTQAIKQVPENKNIINDYLWFLLQNGDKNQLSNALMQYYSILQYDQNSSLLLAQIFLKLGQPQIALQIYNNNFTKIQNNPHFLSEYVEILNNNNFQNSALIRRWLA